MPTSRATPSRRQGSARPKPGVSNYVMDEDTVGSAACLAPGTEVMRRCGVVETRESGLAHLRGRVLRLEGSRVVVAWGKDGREETLSRRRAQTFADAFQRLPQTHEFRRRMSRGLSSSNNPRKSRKRRNEPGALAQEQEHRPTSAVSLRRRRGHAEFYGGEQPPLSESRRASLHKRRSEPESSDEEQEPPKSTHAIRKKRLSEQEVSRAGQAAAHSMEVEIHQKQEHGKRSTHEAEPTGDLASKRQAEGGLLRKQERAMRSKNAVEQLRYRKAEPGQRIEWHGGRGFGSSAEAWVNVGDASAQKLLCEAGHLFTQDAILLLQYCDYTQNWENPDTKGQQPKCNLKWDRLKTKLCISPEIQRLVTRVPPGDDNEPRDL